MATKEKNSGNTNQAWDESFSRGSDLPEKIEKELRYFFINLRNKILPDGVKITFSYFANHLCEGEFGIKGGGIRSRCNRQIDLWARRGKPSRINAEEAPLTSAVYSRHFPDLSPNNDFHRMSDSDSTADEDSSVSSFDTPLPTPRTKPNPKNNTSSSKVPPKPKQKTPTLLPKKNNMNSNNIISWTHKSEANMDACGRDLSRGFSFVNVRSCNRVFAVDPSEHNPELDPRGILCFTVPQQVSTYYELFK